MGGCRWPTTEGLAMFMEYRARTPHKPGWSSSAINFDGARLALRKDLCFHCRKSIFYREVTLLRHMFCVIFSSGVWGCVIEVLSKLSLSMLMWCQARRARKAAAIRAETDSCISSLWSMYIRFYCILIFMHSTCLFHGASQSKRVLNACFL